MEQLDAEIAKVRNELDKLGRKAPSADGRVISLTAARSKYNEKAEERRSNAASCAAKAIEREQQRTEFLERLLRQHAIVCDAVRQAVHRNQQKHDERAAARVRGGCFYRLRRMHK